MEIDAWVASLWADADGRGCETEMLASNGYTPSLGVNHTKNEFTYVRFQPEGMAPFYGYWQPAMSGPAPLLIHTPGYGAEMSCHPDLVALGYNVLHVSPLGYMTPDGPDAAKKRDDTWPVLTDTVESRAERGYKQWLICCVLAIRWAMAQECVIPGRLSFFGTSQGGGASLLLASLYRDRGARCAGADVPFLTNLPLARKLGAYTYRFEPLDRIDRIEGGWNALGFVDTISHASRLTMPVLLSCGGKDIICPAETTRSLFELLPGARSLNYFPSLEHRYSREFVFLFSAWLRMYA
jgi:Acetyl esterase (deacetylase)